MAQIGWEGVIWGNELGEKEIAENPRHKETKCAVAKEWIISTKGYLSQSGMVQMIASNPIFRDATWCLLAQGFQTSGSQPHLTITLGFFSKSTCTPKPTKFLYAQGWDDDNVAKHKNLIPHWSDSDTIYLHMHALIHHVATFAGVLNY